MSLLEQYFENKIFLNMKTKLKSGQYSDYYCNFRNLLVCPKLMDDTANLIIETIKNNNIEFDALCGVLTGGVPITSIVANKLGVKQIIVRDKVKEYGMKNEIDGDLEPGSRVLVIEDVVTTGNSVLEVIHKLRKNQFVVSDTIVLMERTSESRKNIESHNVYLNSLMNVKHLEPFINSFKGKIAKIINEKKTALCLSLDIFDNWTRAVELLDEVGPYICMVKTHQDITKDFQPSIIMALAKKHNFLIMEDRKLIDVPKIAIRQLEEIDTWAHCVTVMVNNYKDIKDHYSNPNNIELIGVCEMNTQNSIPLINSTDPLPENLFTIVSQSKYKNHPELFKITPGVVEEEEDVNDTGRYRKIEKAMFFDKNDVVIIGSNILNNQQPIEKTKSCSSLSWYFYNRNNQL
jgi:orotate phosphoribosyltransferase